MPIDEHADTHEFAARKVHKMCLSNNLALSAFASFTSVWILGPKPGTLRWREEKSTLILCNRARWEWEWHWEDVWCHTNANTLFMFEARTFGTSLASSLLPRQVCKITDKYFTGVTFSQLFVWTEFGICHNCQLLTRLSAQYWLVSAEFLDYYKIYYKQIWRSSLNNNIYSTFCLFLLDF